MGQQELDLTNTSDSIGTAFTADIMIGVTQTPEMKAMSKYKWMLIKNRYGINKVGVTVSIVYDKMQLRNDEDDNQETSSNNGNDNTSTHKSQPKILDIDKHKTKKVAKTSKSKKQINV
jgi:hypothetical protein